MKGVQSEGSSYNLHSDISFGAFYLGEEEEMLHYNLASAEVKRVSVNSLRAVDGEYGLPRPNEIVYRTGELEFLGMPNFVAWLTVAEGRVRYITFRRSCPRKGGIGEATYEAIESYYERFVGSGVKTRRGIEWRTGLSTLRLRIRREMFGLIRTVRFTAEANELDKIPPIDEWDHVSSP